MSKSQNQMVVDSWLHDLGQVAGDKFALNEQGLCVLQHQDSLDIVVETPEQGEAFHIYASLMRLPDHDAQDLLYEALSLNLFQLETAGGTLAIDPRSSEIVFCYMETIEGKSSAIFQNIVNNFIDTALRLRTSLMDKMNGAGTTTQKPPMTQNTTPPAQKESEPYRPSPNFQIRP